MVDPTDFRSEATMNASSIMQSTEGEEDVTCQTDYRASPEATKCVIARPHFWSALRAEIQTLVGL